MNRYDELINQWIVKCDKLNCLLKEKYPISNNACNSSNAKLIRYTQYMSFEEAFNLEFNYKPVEFIMCKPPYSYNCSDVRVVYLVEMPNRSEYKTHRGRIVKRK